MALVDVHAPMARSILEVLVAAGDRVDASQEVVVIEPMETEIPVECPAAGAAAAINVEAGQRIDEAQLLLQAGA